MKNPPGRAPGAPKLRKMVPRVPWTAPRGSPGVPRRSQRGKKGGQEGPKSTLRAPIWVHWDLFREQIGQIWAKMCLNLMSKLINIEKGEFMKIIEN